MEKCYFTNSTSDELGLHWRVKKLSVPKHALNTPSETVAVPRCHPYSLTKPSGLSAGDISSVRTTAHLEAPPVALAFDQPRLQIPDGGLRGLQLLGQARELAVLRVEVTLRQSDDEENFENSDQPKIT